MRVRRRIGVRSAIPARMGSALLIHISRAEDEQQQRRAFVFCFLLFVFFLFLLTISHSDLYDGRACRSVAVFTARDGVLSAGRSLTPDEREQRSRWT